MNLAYLLPAESLRLVYELRYDVITLAFEFAESGSDPEGGDATNRNRFTYNVPNIAVPKGVDPRNDGSASTFTPRDLAFLYASVGDVIHRLGPA